LTWWISTSHYLTENINGFKTTKTTIQKGISLFPLESKRAVEVASNVIVELYKVLK
jgi:hypothetical protein